MRKAYVDIPPGQLHYLTQGDGPWGSLAWTYDKIGNRLTENRDGVATVYSYKQNAADGVLSASVHDGR